MKRKISYTPFIVFWVIVTALLVFRCGYDLKTFLLGSTITVRQPENSPYDYLLHFPKGYHDFGKRPLIIFLHGAGEVGQDVSILDKLDVFHYANGHVPAKDFPFIVVSPVVPKYQHGWEPKRVVRFLDTFLKEHRFRYRIDPTRIYLTGFSMGGFGTFDVAGEFPERFAAIVPLAGGYDPEKADKLQNVPTWAFHGDADDVVDYKCSEKIISAMQQSNHPDVRLMTLHGANHMIPESVYNRPELYEWLLEHKKPNHD